MIAALPDAHEGLGTVWGKKPKLKRRHFIRGADTPATPRVLGTYLGAHCAECGWRFAMPPKARQLLPEGSQAYFALPCPGNERWVGTMPTDY